MKKIEEFNPIKEDKDGIRAKRTIWTSKALGLATKALEEGRKLVANPFYENNIRLLKGDLVFKRTPEEIEEWKKCATDIIYFANNYCHLMTPEGIKQITLRDYQERYLKHLCESQLSIYLACRQASKCVSMLSIIDCQLDIRQLQSLNFLDDKLKKYLLDNYFIKELNNFQLPLFELYNLYDHSISWKIKYQLYKILYKLVWKRAKTEKEVIKKKDIKITTQDT